MRSALFKFLPSTERRSLQKLGRDIANARRKRRLTIAMMAERMGVAPNTYRGVERGDPTVAMGAYAMALFVLGFGGALGEIADVSRDEIGQQLDEARLPRRVRVRKTASSL